jgi:hypothetical protein
MENGASLSLNQGTLSAQTVTLDHGSVISASGTTTGNVKAPVTGC